MSEGNEGDLISWKEELEAAEKQHKKFMDNNLTTAAIGLNPHIEALKKKIASKEVSENEAQINVWKKELKSTKEYFEKSNDSEEKKLLNEAQDTLKAQIQSLGGSVSSSEDESIEWGAKNFPEKKEGKFYPASKAFILNSSAANLPRQNDPLKERAEEGNKNPFQILKEIGKSVENSLRYSKQSDNKYLPFVESIVKKCNIDGISKHYDTNYKDHTARLLRDLEPPHYEKISYGASSSWAEKGVTVHTDSEAFYKKSYNRVASNSYKSKDANITYQITEKKDKNDKDKLFLNFPPEGSVFSAHVENMLQREDIAWTEKKQMTLSLLKALADKVTEVPKYQNNSRVYAPWVHQFVEDMGGQAKNDESSLKKYMKAKNMWE
ncbi:MAG: hypothetical protein BGO07_01230 [Alphaproteobacteria bacterium 40-19]|nr:MAG: hypothetical protein BGO07_01230 [Alphaproteobacteria bacterium 40-19]